MTLLNWPLVDPKDDGIRPAGYPDECFYCSQKIGQPHSHSCVTVKKKVRLRVIVEVDMDQPHSQTPDDIERRYNQGSWCANNALQWLQNKIVDKGSCLCGDLKVEFVSVLDDTPTRELRA